MPPKSRAQKANSANIAIRWAAFKSAKDNESDVSSIDSDVSSIDSELKFTDVLDDEYESTEDFDVDDFDCDFEDIILELKSKNWREVGFNTNKRGCGTRESTYYRQEKKKKLTESAAKLTNNSILKFPQKISFDSSLPINQKLLDTVDDLGIDCVTISDDESDNTEGEIDRILTKDEEGIITDSFIKVLSEEEALTKLISDERSFTRNEKMNAEKKMYGWHALRITSVRLYFKLRSAGLQKMKASEEVALVIYRKSGKYSYKARTIRFWAEYYQLHGSFPIYK